MIGGSWENYVGWFSNDGRVTLNIEFAGECRFDEIRVYSLKDGNSSIYPPAAVETRWGNDFPSSAYDGFGALPEELLTRENGFRYLADKGYVQIRLPQTADSNFVTLLIDPHGWFFASEIEFYLNGRHTLCGMRKYMKSSEKNAFSRFFIFIRLLSPRSDILDQPRPIPEGCNDKRRLNVSGYSSDNFFSLRK